MTKKTCTFSYDEQADKDLVTWLKAQPARGRSAAIRQMLRAGIQGRGATVTTADILAAVEQVQADIRDLKRRGLALAAQDPIPDEPPDIAAALDGLGQL